jgi:hypothetical protein
MSAAPAPQTGQLGCAVEERQCWSMADCDLYFRSQGWHMTTCFASTCCEALVERGPHARAVTATHLFQRCGIFEHPETCASGTQWMLRPGLSRVL